MAVADIESPANCRPLLAPDVSHPAASSSTAPVLPRHPSPAALAALRQAVIESTFKSTANLAKLLPTGTVLTFQLLSPAFSNHGRCDALGRDTTGALIALCAVTCVIHSFTDSFTADDGTVRYGVATFRGMWVLDWAGSSRELLPPEKAGEYRVRFIDFVHALASVLVFAAVVLFDQDVVSCFWPLPSDHAREMLAVLPVGIGVICSLLFIIFPTTRHGIGFPITPH